MRKGGVSRQAHCRGSRRGGSNPGEGSSRVERVDRESSLKIMSMLQRSVEKKRERRGGRRGAAEDADDPAVDPYQFSEDGEPRRPAVVRTYARSRLPNSGKGSAPSPAAAKLPAAPRRDPAKPTQILESMKQNFNEPTTLAVTPGGGSDAVEATLGGSVTAEGAEQKTEQKPDQKAEKRSPAKRVRPRKPVTDDEGLDRVIEEVIRSWAAEDGEKTGETAPAESKVTAEATASSPKDKTKTKSVTPTKSEKASTKNATAVIDDSAQSDKQSDASSTSATRDVSNGGDGDSESGATARVSGQGQGEIPAVCSTSKTEPSRSKPTTKSATKPAGPRSLPSDVEAQLADWDA